MIGAIVFRQMKVSLKCKLKIHGLHRSINDTAPNTESQMEQHLLNTNAGQQLS